MPFEAEQAVALAKCLAPLADEAFPVATWNADAVAIFTTKGFIKAVNILTHGTDKVFFRRLLDRGNAGDWWEAPATCTPDQMYNFCTWLKSSEGAAFIDEQRHVRRLEKKAFAWQTVEDGCYLRAMEAQLNELVVTEKATRAKERGEKKEREMEEAIRAIKADYAPASAYVPPNEMELREKCYKLYKDECARRGKAAMDSSDEILRDAAAAFGNEAVAMHRTEYMREGRRRDEVKVWLEEKIVDLDRLYKTRQANSFRFYLKTVGGQVSPRARAEVEERAIAAGSRRRIRRRVSEEDDSQDIVRASRRQRMDTENVEQGQRRSRSICP